MLALGLGLGAKGTCWRLRACACSVISDAATPWTVARQAPLSMRFPRQEYWRGLPSPPLGDLPDSGIEPVSPASPAPAGGFFTTVPPGKPCRRPHSLWETDFGREHRDAQCWSPGFPIPALAASSENPSLHVNVLVGCSSLKKARQIRGWVRIFQNEGQPTLKKKLALICGEWKNVKELEPHSGRRTGTRGGCVP